MASRMRVFVLCALALAPAWLGAVSTVADVSLVRERSSPKVFLVVGNVKLWVEAPDFGALGLRAERVQVVEDHTLDALVERRLRPAAATLTSDAFSTCAPQTVNDCWQGDCASGRNYPSCPESWPVVRRDVLVAGWLTASDERPVMPFVHRISPQAVEDVYYDLALDVRFLDRLYGSGLSDALNGARFARVHAPPPIAANFFADFAAPNLLRGVTANSWFVPCSPLVLHNELNAWNEKRTGGVFTSHMQGLGAPPADWTTPVPGDTNAWFAFDIFDPVGSGTPLKAGDYVVVRGSLRLDDAHDAGGDTWGWLEIHPVDWVVPIATPPGPNARLTARAVTFGTDYCGPKRATANYTDSIVPDFAASPNGVPELRSFQRLVDYRFTSSGPGQLVDVGEIPRATQLDVRATIRRVGNTPAYFKGAWIAGWRERDVRDRVIVDDEPPAGATLGGEDGWRPVLGPEGPFMGVNCHDSPAPHATLVTPHPLLHQHFYENARSPVAVAPGETMFAMVYLDPADPPDEIMLQWRTAGWLHRAYWGANQIPYGTDGTPDRRPMGPLPRSGEWVRLEVAADAVGLGGTGVNGMAFTAWGGHACWDYAGVRGR